MTTNIRLSLKDRARVKELYHIMPDLSARDIAKQLGLRRKDTMDYMKLLGYTAEKHNEARKARLMPQKKKVVSKPHPQQKPTNTAISPYAISHNPSPDTMERKRQKVLNTKANKLLEEAMKAGEEGRMDDYLRLRKEYEVASRQAEAYKMRGSLSATDKVIYGLESQYTTIM